MAALAAATGPRPRWLLSQQPSMSPLAAHAAAEALVRRAGELGSLDNVCVLVAWVEWGDGEEGGAGI